MKNKDKTHLVKYTIHYDGSYTSIEELRVPVQMPVWDDDYFQTFLQAKAALKNYFRERILDNQRSFKEARRLKRSEVLKQ